MSLLKRRPIPLLILGTSALGTLTYRFLLPSSSSTSTSLNPHTFTPYTLIDKQRVSSTSAIFTLRNSNAGSEPESVKQAWGKGVWSVQIKQPELQIARAYTPLPISGEENQDGGGDKTRDMRLLIRQETGGEVSTYLHGLPVPSTLELRGPHVELQVAWEEVEEVVFLAGGTGIAPAMQIARILGGREGSRMDVFWANRRREECIGGGGDERNIAQSRKGWFRGVGGSRDAGQQVVLANRFEDEGQGVIVKELDALKALSSARKNELNVQYYVDEERTFIQPNEIARRISQPREDAGSRLIIVSGPEGFLEYWAG
ncbi:hypothetical protein T440DRAFT_464362, partial [Plenodomus tracheiphilus IPT5]